MAEASAQPLAVQVQRAFQMPGSRMVGLMLTVATLIAVLVAGYLWSQAPDYRVLYGSLGDRDGGSVIAALQQLNIPYKFADGGALMVPANQIHELRLKLAAQGLPKGGLVGFELMENQKFGTSQFAEQINYQRALEGELARSIQSLSVVQSARVHLAISKPSAFLREQTKPSASVMLSLYAGRTLDPAQVGAIVHLVSNSVPDLQAQNVTLVDQHGNLLSSEKAKSQGLDPDQLKYRLALEQGYNARIEAILTPIVGDNNVRAEVAADLDFSESEHAEEIFKPNQDPAAATMRSQQNSESAGGAAASAGGVPGALSNQPPSTPTAPITAAPGGAPAPAPANAQSNTRKDATINYEVDKTIRHTRQEIGRIKRLAVAVVVNNRKLTDAAGKSTSKPLTAPELTQITDLVKQVTGYDTERGDTLSVVNSPFSVAEKEKIVEVPLWKRPETIDFATTVGKNVLIAGVMLFLVLGVLRPLLKSYSAGPKTAPLAEESADDGLESPVSYEHNIERAKQIARSDPKIVANVVKDWVTHGK